MYEILDITWYTIHSKEITAPIAERIILTTKRKIVKFITHFNSDNVLLAIYQIVDTYNNINHRMLSHKPRYSHVF